MLRVDGTGGNDFFDLDDGVFCGAGHDRIEISGGEAVSEIAQFVGFLGFDEGEVSVDGGFEDAALCRR